MLPTSQKLQGRTDSFFGCIVLHLLTALKIMLEMWWDH